MAKYPIGFWNYETLGKGGGNVDEWAELGVTVTMTPQFNPALSQKEDMIALLDQAHEKGIQCIIYDKRLADWFPTSYNEERMRAAITAVTEDFGSHPAVVGYHLSDESGVYGPEEVKGSIEVYKLMKEIAPHLKPFLNLHPWHMTDLSTSGLMDRPNMRYVDVLEEYAHLAHLDYFCYDCYSQMRPGDTGFNMYFRNLEMYREAGDRVGIPYWTTLLCTEHFNYHAPSRDEYRWQVNTAAAHGCKGLLWFYLYPSVEGSCPIDITGRKTEAFYHMAAVHKAFLDKCGDILLHSHLEAVYHVNRTYGGVQLFEDWMDPLCFSSATPWDKGLILSRFRHEDGSLYYAMTNLSSTEQASLSMYFRCDENDYYPVASTGEIAAAPAKGDGTRTGYLNSWRDTPAICLGDWFLPGEMKMWKVVPKKK